MYQGCRVSQKFPTPQIQAPATFEIYNSTLSSKNERKNFKLPKITLPFGGEEGGWGDVIGICIDFKWTQEARDFRMSYYVMV